MEDPPEDPDLSSRLDRRTWDRHHRRRVRGGDRHGLSVETVEGCGRGGSGSTSRTTRWLRPGDAIFAEAEAPPASMSPQEWCP